MPSPRLLVIDDDDLSRDVIELLLTDDGFTVLAFPSGEAALHHLASAAPAPDAVLTDLQMPGLHGPALAQALRPRLPAHTPILAASASHPSPATLTAFDGFLPKPFTPAQLRDLLDPVTPGVLDLAASASDDPSPPEASPPALDTTVFNELAALMRPAQLYELVALCFSEIARHTRAMHRARAAHDPVAFRAAAHALKGGVAMIGARELQALATDLETADAHVVKDPAYQLSSLAKIPPATARLQRILGARGVALPPGPFNAQGDPIA